MMQTNCKATSIPMGLLKKYDRPGPRYTSYPTVPVWTEDFDSEDYKKSLKNASMKTGEPLAIYCHIPFCKSRCYYCGCSTYISRSDEKIEKYINALLGEITTTAGLLGKRRLIGQIHFGGGTPNFIKIKDFDKILRHLEKHFHFAEDCEKSLEIDPRITTAEQIDFLAERGFNRISIGVQDFDLSVQEAIGRIQPFEKVQSILEYCRKRNFKGINIDLIYGLPRQNPDSFKTTLELAISLRPDRVALYSFAFLPSVKSHQLKINKDELPETEAKYRLFADAIKAFTGAGYRQIGMDHFALPEDELSLAQSDGRLHRNFMGYTVKSSPEMLGLGMSSIGYIDNSFFQNFSKLDSYINTVNDKDFAIFKGIKLNQDDLIRQYVITSLMCNFHLNFNNLADKFDIKYHDYFKEEHQKLAEFFTDDLLEVPNTGLEITPIGRAFVRNIAMTFDAYLKKDAPGKKPTFSRTI